MNDKPPDRHYRVDVFMVQYHVVEQFVKHLTLHRALFGETDQAEKKKSHLVTLGSDAHLMVASVTWCSVFGAWGNDTHWQNLALTEEMRESFKERCPEALQPSQVDSEKYQDELMASFVDRFCEELRIERVDWERYHEDMSHFRNNYVAHRSASKYNRPVPSFDLALKIAFCWDRWVREVIAPDDLKVPLLQNEVDHFQRVANAEVRGILPAIRDENFPPHPDGVA